MRTRVLFLSQQRLVRECFERAMRGVGEVDFLAPVSSTEAAVRSIRRLGAEVLLVDLNPSLFGIRMAREIRQACPACRIIALSSHPDPVVATQLGSVGVHGFLTKDIGIEELLWAIQEAAAGRRVNRMDEGSGANRCLTPREMQVLELIASGFANKQVAAELSISIKTVEKYRKNLMQKLQAHETAGLSWRAFCLGVAHGGCNQVQTPDPIPPCFSQ